MPASTVQAGGGDVMGWRIFSGSTLAPTVPKEHHLNTAAHLRTVTDNIHPYMATGHYHLLLPAGQCQVRCTPVASTVTRSQANRSPLGWGRFAAAATA